MLEIKVCGVAAAATTTASVAFLCGLLTITLYCFSFKKKEEISWDYYK